MLHFLVENINQNIQQSAENKRIQIRNNKYIQNQKQSFGGREVGIVMNWGQKSSDFHKKYNGKETVKRYFFRDYYDAK